MFKTHDGCASVPMGKALNDDFVCSVDSKMQLIESDTKLFKRNVMEKIRRNRFGKFGLHLSSSSTLVDKNAIN